MYFNINENIEYHMLPNNAFNSQRSLVQNLPFADIDTKADCGFYIIRNDSPPQTENTIEQIESRIIVIDKPYVDITRTWIPIT